MDDAELDQLKKNRSVKKSALTRNVNDLRRLLAEDQGADVARKFDAVKLAFRNFSEAHELYHNELADDNLILISERYFDDAQENYIKGIAGVREYVQDLASFAISPESKAQPARTVVTPAPSSSSVNRPTLTLEPSVFAGKPETFPMWKASFNVLVDKYDIDYDEKMLFLKKYTSGEAQSAIEALFLCPDKESYQSAMHILETRFGNPSLVTSAFRQKLEKFKKFGDKDTKSLQSFADLLRQVSVAKKTYQALSILDDEFENQKLVQKLPPGLASRWIELVVVRKEFPDFDTFKDYVNAKAEVANHPLWSGSGQGSSPSDNSDQTSSSKKSQTFASHTESHSTSSQMLPQSGQMLPQSGQMLTQSSQMLPQSGQMLPQSGQMLPQSSQMLPQSGQMLNPSGQMMLPPSCQMLPPSGQSMYPYGQMLPPVNDMYPASAVNQYRVGTSAVSPFQGSPYQGGTPSVGTTQVCPICNEGHRVYKCPIFNSMSLTERMDTIRTRNICFGCLTVGHFSKECRRRHTCYICQRKHPTLLHDYSRDIQNQTGVVTNGSSDQSAPKQGPVTYSSSSQTTSQKQTVTSGSSMLLDTHDRGGATTMVMPVTVSHPSSKHEIVVYALLDTQSNTHFISKETAESLGVTGNPTTLELTTLNGKKRSSTDVIQNLEIKGLNSDYVIKLSRCFTRDSIPCSRECIPTTETIKNWSHLSDVQLPPYCAEAPVGLLIGYTCPEVFRPVEIAPGKGDEPFGWKTRLGWCIVGLTSAEQTGEVDEIGPSHVVHGCIALRSSCKEIIIETQSEVSEGAEVDILTEKGIINADNEDLVDLNSHARYSAEDKLFMDIMKSSMVQCEDGHYEAPLPMKGGSQKLPNNKVIALQRLLGLRSRFEKDKKYHQKYTEVVEEMIQCGFAEQVPDQQTDQSGRVWYVPHHGVSNKEKLRVVFDCSAKFQNVCINDLLLQGPDLLNKLLGILLRFRMKPIALTCDIQKMYHQFRVKSEDRDLLRFLWWPNGELSVPPQDCRMRVHLFGATSSPGVATYALRKIVTDHAHKYPDEVSEFVKRDFYVDDGVRAVDTDKQGHDLLTATQQLLDEGALKCHKIMSNSSQLMALIPAADRAPEKADSIHKTLGVAWNVRTDEIHIPLRPDSVKLTRRGLLSFVSSIFDPLGLVSPLLLAAKLVLQETCRENHSWDEPLPPDLLAKSEKWLEGLREICQVHLPRCVTPDTEAKSVEVHHFADSSVMAYSACSYLRVVDINGTCHVTLLLGKCRVVPLKPVLTIPRLELTAAVLAVQLASVLRRELPFSYTEYFWTDSNIVLGYIKNTAARYKVFVANRIQKIHDGSSPDQWHHVFGTDNPADDGSRALFSERWLGGPGFLQRADFELVDVPLEVDASDIEVKCLSSQSEEVEPVVEVHTYKGWFSTKKVWAWVLRFIRNCRGQSPKLSGDLSVDEIHGAEIHLLRMVQKSELRPELVTLKQGKPISRTSKLHKLDVFLDDQGLLRVGGRLRHGVTLSQELKHPVVLSESHVISRLIIEYYHMSTHHQGRGITASEVRSHGFWIVRLGKLVKRLIQSCVICRRLRGKPCEQKMADLPADRSETSPVFTFCGCDLFGPYIVKSGRKELKRYGLIFTCLVSRAVHLEAVHSLSSDSFLNAFRRFVALRGPVRQLRCDQGTNFVGAKSDLIKMGCDLVLNPPASSHRGGVWERLIGVSRRVIEGILKEHGSRLDDEGLTTLLAEAASVVNSRPLNVDNLYDPNSLEPITPNHLLTMKTKVITKPFMTDVESRSDLYGVRQWRRVQRLTELFWSRWKREILHHCQTRSKWNKVRKNVKENDLVLIVDEQLHRSEWKLARVSKVKNSPDGLVRSVTLILGDRSQLERPIQKLVPIYSELND